MLLGAVRIAALEEQEGQAVVRAGQLRGHLERAAVAADRLFRPIRLCECDGHVLKNLGVVWPVAKREPIRRQRGVVVALPLERHRLAQIVEALRSYLSIGSRAKNAAPPGHTARTCWRRNGGRGDGRARTHRQPVPRRNQRDVLARGKATRSRVPEQRSRTRRLHSLYSSTALHAPIGYDHVAAPHYRRAFEGDLRGRMAALW